VVKLWLPVVGSTPAIARIAIQLGEPVPGAIRKMTRPDDLTPSRGALERSSGKLWGDTAQRLQLALSAGEMGDWVWEAESNLLFLSQRAAQIFGLPGDTPVRREELRALVPPDDGVRTKQEFDRALMEGGDYSLDFRVLLPGGVMRWLASRGRPVYADDGAVLGLVGVVQDITERRQAEELRSRLAAVVESSSDAVITKTLDSIVTTWNQGAERMFGYKAEEVVGRSVTLLIPPNYVDEEPSILERLKRGERIEHYETVRRRKDGTLLEVSLAVSPVKDVHGSIIGSSTIARDITRQRQAEETLRETDRRKDEFLATLAHELRNPLAPIRQAALISQVPTATEAQKRWSHEVINRQVQHMALLLDDLLDISRITRGTLALRTEMTNLEAIVDAAVETARPSIEAKRHRFSVELPAGQVALAADPLRLAQVLSNLLTNAAKYTDPDGRIHLRAVREDDQISLSVTDTGIGIPREAIGNLFSMFSQVNSSKDRSEGGLGIGLALAKGLVELHGGSIEARSAGVERGSEFIVRLPVRTQPVRQASVRPRLPAETRVQRKVLIADDNRDAAESLAMLLQIEGHDVTVVHDGREAITAFESLHPDVALLDIGMPGVNGYDIARHIRRSPHGRSIMLIAVTGWGQDSDKAQAAEAGFNHHFTKPMEPDVLSALLARNGDG
jgi:PAS domain S-box-containing protein